MKLAERVTALLRTDVVSTTLCGAAITGERWRLRLADDPDVFVKARTGAPDGFFATEAVGLDWLGGADGGAQDGWIGAAELENGPADGWPEFYATRRILPYVQRLRDTGQVSADEAAVFDRLATRLPDLAGPAEPPARIHGDLWSGNVLWSSGRGWLVDPAAHGGHRETDLAMLTLFDAGWVPRLLAAYAEVTPPADGWRERQRLHQVHPLLVHAVLFGGGYLSAALSAAAEYV